MEREDDKQRKPAPDEQEPIRDGDTRPDQIVGDADIVRKEIFGQKKDEVTISRKADVDTSEDYRDARIEE